MPRLHLTYPSSWHGLRRHRLDQSGMRILASLGRSSCGQMAINPARASAKERLGVKLPRNAAPRRSVALRSFVRIRVQAARRTVFGKSGGHADDRSAADTKSSTAASAGWDAIRLASRGGPQGDASIGLRACDDRPGQVCAKVFLNRSMRDQSETRRSSEATQATCRCMPSRK